MTSPTLTYPVRPPSRLGRALRGVAGFSFIVVVALFVLGGASLDLFQFFLWCGIFLGGVVLARPLSGRAVVGERESILSSALVIWTFLMISEAIFVHNRTTVSAEKGNVDPSAMYQAVSWILSLGVLILLSCFRPAYLRRLFVGPLKWPCIFAIVVVISCAIATKPMYSGALAFKLCVIILVLCIMAEAIEDEAGVLKLFAALFVGIIITVSMQSIGPFLQPGPAFVNGRLGAMIGLSGTCGLLLLLSLLFLWITKTPWFLLCALYSVVVMMLAGTKGGIVASFVSLMMFFLLLKRPAQAIAVSVVFGIIFILCLIFTPLGSTLEKYSESGNASTLTGRTNLWSATLPVIETHPILGKGYRDSRFLSEDVPNAFAEAGNMHNSFLEVLYNNGLAGLIPIVIINIIIVLNLKRALLRPPTLRQRYFAAAAFALYIHLFVWGIISVTFGGAPDNRFMTFFALLVISMFLRSQSDMEYRNKIYGTHSSR
jgi:O-antigen ligase